MEESGLEATVARNTKDIEKLQDLTAGIPVSIKNIERDIEYMRSQMDNYLSKTVSTDRCTACRTSVDARIDQIADTLTWVVRAGVGGMGVIAWYLLSNYAFR